MSDQSEREKQAGAESVTGGPQYQGTPTPVVVTGGGTVPDGEPDLNVVTIGPGGTTTTPPAVFDVLEPVPGAPKWVQSRSHAVGLIHEVTINNEPLSCEHPLKLTFMAGENTVFTIEEEPGPETYQICITAVSPDAVFTTTEPFNGGAWVKALAEPLQQITQIVCRGNTEPIRVTSLFTVNLNFIIL